MIVASAGCRLGDDRDIIEGSDNLVDQAHCAFDGPVPVPVLKEARLRLSRSCDQQERQQGPNEGQQDAMHGQSP